MEDFKLVTSPSKSICFGDRSAPAVLNKSGKQHSSLRAELPAHLATAQMPAVGCRDRGRALRSEVWGRESGAQAPGTSGNRKLGL